MRSIREKLFLSVGSIFLFIALLSYFVPHLFVRKDIDKASAHLNSYYLDYQKKQTHLSTAWISERFVKDAAQLLAISHSIQVENQPLWQLAASALNQDPIIVVVQATDHMGNSVVIQAENGRAYNPEWAQDETGKLWVKIDDHAYETEPLNDEQSIYLLYEKAMPSFNFQQYIPVEPTLSSQSTIQEAFNVLYKEQTEQLEKNNLIQKLAPYHSKAAGIMQVDQNKKSLIAYLTAEIFLSKPIFTFKEPKDSIFMLSRTNGKYVDLMSFVTKKAPYVIVGSSLSSIAVKIASTIEKPVLLYDEGNLVQAFDAKGELINPKELVFVDQKVLVGDKTYIPNSMPIGPLNFSVLSTEDEKNLIPHLFANVRKKLETELSLNLLLLSFILFLIAIFLLARISKKITTPITQLALVSEEIGAGKYEGLQLPDVAKRHDEVAILTNSFEKMTASLMDREKIRGVLNKVVSKEIASTILNSTIELGGEERYLTMLFSDIRGFTPLSETMPPQKLIALLNDYMTRMCRIIDATHGVVDKFVGDEIMALYGAPVFIENHADRALECAWQMIEDLKTWNQMQSAKEISIGIGIHTGSAFAGNMGAENRLNYTVVGSNVNLAARLCSAALPMQILVSKETMQCLIEPERFQLQQLPAIMLKGIEEPVPIYQLMGYLPKIK